MVGSVFVKALIIHLSDIHISTGNEAVLQRASRIASAVAPFERNPDAVFLVISGDISFSGKQLEFLAAKTFLDVLKGEFQGLFKNAQIEIVTVPGNHDCDFAEDNSIRQLVLKSV